MLKLFKKIFYPRLKPKHKIVRKPKLVRCLYVYVCRYISHSGHFKLRTAGIFLGMRDIYITHYFWYGWPEY